MSIVVKQIKIPARIQSMSLINVLDHKRPVARGNYFDFRSSSLLRSNPHCVNMWAENLIDAIKREILTDGFIEVRVYGEDETWALVVDKRLPADYLSAKPNFTSVPQPPADILEDILAHGNFAEEKVEAPKEVEKKTEKVKEPEKVEEKIETVEKSEDKSTDVDAEALELSAELVKDMIENFSPVSERTVFQVDTGDLPAEKASDVIAEYKVIKADKIVAETDLTKETPVKRGRGRPRKKK